MIFFESMQITKIITTRPAGKGQICLLTTVGTQSCHFIICLIITENKDG
jgi:hypothetical protein